jgi:hypothetical protein
MGFKFGDGSVIVADETKRPRTVHGNTLCRPSACGHDVQYVITSNGQTSSNGSPIQSGNIRSPSVEISLWEMLWGCRKADDGITEGVFKIYKEC